MLPFGYKHKFTSTINDIPILTELPKPEIVDINEETDLSIENRNVINREANKLHEDIQKNEQDPSNNDEVRKKRDLYIENKIKEFSVEKKEVEEAPKSALGSLFAKK
jgi:hypothetical protein